MSNLNPIQHSYSSAGEYFPVVTIVTTGGSFSSSGGWNSADPGRLRINVQAPPVQQNVINVTDPVDIKTDGAGNLYVLSKSTAAITEFDGSGAIVRSLSGIGTSPSGLDVDGSGNVYVADTGDNQVLKFNPTTSSFQLDASFNGTGYVGKSDKTSGSGNGEFNAPFDVAVSPDGAQIAVSDSGNNRIQMFSTGGWFLNSFGSYGSAVGQFVSPKGLTYDGVGYLYIVDSGNNRIAVSSSSLVDGTSGSFGTALGQLLGPLNLGVGDRGIYVADTGNNRVQSFDPLTVGHGAPLTPFNSRGSISTQLSLNQPNAVAPVANFLEEDIYIADTGNNRVILVELPSDNPEAVWNSMKQSLLAGDINAAASYFSGLSADKYRQAFLSIGTSSLNPLISQIPTITPAVIEGDSAQYSFDQVIQGVTITFPIDFVKENGIWKIDSF